MKRIDREWKHYARMADSCTKQADELIALALDHLRFAAALNAMATDRVLIARGRSIVTLELNAEGKA